MMMSHWGERDSNGCKGDNYAPGRREIKAAWRTRAKPGAGLKFRLPASLATGRQLEPGGRRPTETTNRAARSSRVELNQQTELRPRRGHT